MEYPSELLSRAVEEIAKLPGIGKRTALKLALHLLKQPPEYTRELTEALSAFRREVRYCSRCHNISDTDTCEICADPARDHSLICVVEDVRDVLAIENTGQYRGVYHVLGGLISPMEGVGPEDIFLPQLVERVRKERPREIILALSPTVEGDTTGLYIYKKVKDTGIPVSTLARGVAFGEEIEFADEMTLARSLANRIPFENSLKF
ncbi:MAG: recombination protein RecR [Chlorobi bacterium]|nr:recombination protein RecR [Chlorobiota bacterium]